MRRRRNRLSPFAAGLLAIVLIGTASTVGWFRLNPFSHTYEMQAEFSQVANVGQRSPVRIAGVEVGKVTKVTARPGGGGRVTMQLKRSALPIHRDAQLKIRPRIFFEGNFFVDLQPGTPSAPILKSDEVIPASQTAAPVQIGDVTTALQSDVRHDLQTLLHEYGRALGGGAAQSLNRAAPVTAPALRNLALASDASLGEEPTKDIQRSLDGTARTAGAFAEDQQALQGLVTNLGETAGALASEDRALSASVPALRDTLRVARPSLGALDRTLPPLRGLAVAATPSVRRLDPVLTATLPFTRQLRGLVRPTELQATARSLRRYTPAIDRLIRVSPGLFAQGRAASRCTNRVLVPFVQSDFPDPDFAGNTGTVNQKLMRSFVGLSGESRPVDANQSYFHASVAPPGLQVRPAPPDNPSVPPPHRPDVPCETQQKPNLEAPTANITQAGQLSPRILDGITIGGPPAIVRSRAVKAAGRSVDSWVKRIEQKRERILSRETHR